MSNTRFKKGQTPFNKYSEEIEEKCVNLYFKNKKCIKESYKIFVSENFKIAQCTYRDILKRKGVYENPWDDSLIVEFNKHSNGYALAETPKGPAKISLVDLHLLKNKTTRVCCQKTKWGENNYITVGSTKLHKLILNNKTRIVDHKNRDSLDNRRCNLRYITSSGNAANRKVNSRNKVGLKGVSFIGKSFYARLRKKGVEYRFGPFESKEKAYKAYLKQSKEIHGEFGYEEKK